MDHIDGEKGTYKANNYIPDDHHVPYTVTFGYGPHVWVSTSTKPSMYSLDKLDNS